MVWLSGGGDLNVRFLHVWQSYAHTCIKNDTDDYER